MSLGSEFAIFCSNQYQSFSPYVIVYCKVIILLTWPLIFIVGIAQTQANGLSWPLTDYSYLNARGDHDIGSIRPRLVRCMTGLGPSGRNGNGILGGW